MEEAKDADFKVVGALEPQSVIPSVNPISQLSDTPLYTNKEKPKDKQSLIEQILSKKPKEIIYMIWVIAALLFIAVIIIWMVLTAITTFLGVK